MLRTCYEYCLQIVVKHALEISFVVALSVITYKEACAIIECMERYDLCYQVQYAFFSCCG